MTQHYPAQEYYSAPAAPPRNGMGTSALVLGIVGTVLAVIPIIGFFGFICGILGVIFGIIGISRAGRRLATNKNTAIGGTIFSVLAVIISLSIFGSFVNSFNAAAGTDSPPTTVTVPTALPEVVPAPAAPAEPAAAAPVASSGPMTSIPPGGPYEVGVDIEAGKYKTAGPDGDSIVGCYYSRLKNNDGAFGDIIDNNITEGQATVTIKESDGYFETNGCQVWEKVS